MRLLLPSLLVLLLVSCGRAPKESGVGSQESEVGTGIFSAEDVANYWRAYDLAVATTDTTEQDSILEREFFSKGTPGLPAVMAARRYTKREYRQNINRFPKFWASIRPSMERAPDLIKTVAEAADRLHDLYPSSLPAEVYFTVGCFRTNGTVVDSLILFGTELCTADENIDLSEWPARMDGLKPYMQSNPVADLDFLAVHEYVHSRQPVRNGYNLLGEVLFEGIPEFVATIAADRPSVTPAIAYGAANEQRVREAFIADIGTPFIYDWLQNNTDNEFNTRDLGYYVGYAMAKRFYDAAEDKHAAIATMIELDYQDSVAVSRFADQTGFFERPVDEYLTAYNAARPRVTGIKEFNNGDQDVDPSLTEITLTFDRPMQPPYASTELGPSGMQTVTRMQGTTWSDDGRSVTYQTTLDPGRDYEFVAYWGYRDAENRRLVPYLVKFRTR